VATRDTNEAELAEMMVGRAVRRAPMVTEREPGEALLKVSGLSWTDARGVKRLHDLNFELRAGEIVGVAGVAGNGQSELLQVLSGIDAMQEGQIELGGQLIDASREVDARGMRALGLSHVPEDRHKQGLVMSFQAWESAALGYHREGCYAKLGLMDQGQMKADCQAMMNDFDVRPPLPLLGSSKFSGGNQQKLILAREMKHAPKVLLIGQPTRGVDIGAIELIHQRIVAMRDAGVAVLVVSTELDEILGLSDRVLVMNEGHITGELSREEADEPSIGRLMAHSKKGARHEAAVPETPSEGVAR
jgi:simple sugar transport system ATP-binding protein